MSKQVRRVRSRSEHKQKELVIARKSSSNRASKNSLEAVQQNQVIHFILHKDGWAILLAIILTLTALWYFGFYTGNYAITTVTVTETEFINQQEVEDVIWEYINGNTALVIPHNTYWTVSTATITDVLNEKFSHFAIEYIQVIKEKNSISITIKERIPSVQWTSGLTEDNKVYVVDKTGLITQEKKVDDTANEENTSEKRQLPLITDMNREVFDIGWHIMSQNYIQSVLTVNESLEKVTSLQPVGFTFPETTCQKREFVAEEIYQQELLNSASQEFYDKKIEIQQLFSDGLLTIDQSIDALEQIKNEELQSQGATDSAVFESFEWQVVYNEIECDFVKIASELDVIAQVPEKGQIVIKMDITEDITIQLENVRDIIRQKEDVQNAEYIDVRIQDRIYYK